MWKAQIKTTDYDDKMAMLLYQPRTDRQHPMKVVTYKESDLFVDDKAGVEATRVALEVDFERGRELVQAMMDAAWAYGIRPTGVRDLEFTNVALVRHLDDMRQLAFALTKVEKPK